MAYQFQNTTTNEDAIKLVKDKWLRIKYNPQYAKEALENSCKFSEIIYEIKRNSYSVVKSLLEKDFLINLGETLEKKLFDSLPGMEVRAHTKENHSDSMEIFYEKLPNNADFEYAKKITAGISLKDPLIEMPNILEIIKNKTLEGVVTGYYQSIPKLTFAKARISFFDSIGPRDTQFWHSDPGSYTVLKALIYLNDVDEKGGPFEIISGSHFKKFQNWDKITRHSQSNLKKFYNTNKFIKITGSLGDVIFADATAFHKGNVPIDRNRKIIILNFCLNEEYGLPYEKVKINKADLLKSKGITKCMLENLEIIGN